MKIALLLEHGSTASSVAATLDMFRLAERFQPGKGWSPSLYSAHGGTVHLIEKLTIQTEHMPASLGEFDAIILPGFSAESAEGIAGCLRTAWFQTVEHLRNLPSSTIVAASCYGTFALAEAGMLDGLPATTTWWFADVFRQRYPKVQLDVDEALVDSGNVITAGAMTAHTDLVLHVLRRLGGGELARRVGASCWWMVRVLRNVPSCRYRLSFLIRLWGVPSNGWKSGSHNLCMSTNGPRLCISATVL